MNIPIVGILRSVEHRYLAGVLGAAIKGGLQQLEITMNSPGAVEQIREAVRLGRDRMRIGAGTVTSLELLERALEAGAQFIVTPTLNEAVVRQCRHRKVPIYSGAWSPTEVAKAWEWGAAMVKFFPAEIGGPEALLVLKESFPEISLMPTGGVDLETLPKFIRAGAAGAGIGSPLFPKDRIAAADWPWLEQHCRAYVTCWRSTAAVAGA